MSTLSDDSHKRGFLFGSHPRKETSDEPREASGEGCPRSESLRGPDGGPTSPKGAGSDKNIPQDWYARLPGETFLSCIKPRAGPLAQALPPVRVHRAPPGDEG